MKLFDSVQFSGCKPDIVTYNTVLKGLCSVERWEDAERLMVEMIHNNCPPDEVTLNTIITSLCQKGLHWQAIEFLKLIPEKGCIPNSTTYDLIVGELLKAGQIQGGFNLVCGMGNSCHLDVITYNRVLLVFPNLARWIKL
jgi:pentatricopeptide repeat protein